MNIPDDISENLDTFLGWKYLNSLMRIRIRDLIYPVSGMEKLDPILTYRICNTDTYLWTCPSYFRNTVYVDRKTIF